ncbi:DUF2254 domain-containing protein [Bacillus mangrovi]|uniref:DUF2254 domain-containing protein n=1 Tax=Metabacillus mangrovi TaxID=1491830 RepID=A0A7X2V629_9BACI|nr:DUF2254 domain-containing protein [Metabacillus mangrovi]MTH55437.1 DUF2254 domain-containing protein [Metabacillus mangrovi]
MSIFSKWSLQLKSLTKRQFINELRSQIWFAPLIYCVYAAVLAGATLYLDFSQHAGARVPAFLSVSFELTNTLISTIAPAVLTLTTFTFNLILVSFTSMAGQYSPRILKNFIASKASQRILGIFIGSFLYTMIVFLASSSKDSISYFAIPYTVAFLVCLSAGTFVYFINHAVRWLQVNHMAESMKKDSTATILNSLETDLEPYRTIEAIKLEQQIPEEDGFCLHAEKSGYIQIVNYEKILKLASEKELIVRMVYDVGEFILKGNPLFCLYRIKDKSINEEDFHHCVLIGEAETDVQDIHFNIMKFVEMAIRSLGNDDIKTATIAIHQISDLLRTICRVTQFSPYLSDDGENLRVIMKQRNFEDYLYDSYSAIRHYSRDNITMTIEIVKALRNLASSIEDCHETSIWHFATFIVKGFEERYLFERDVEYLLTPLKQLSTIAGKEKEFAEIEQRMELYAS